MEQQDGSADLFANFAGVLVLVVAVLMTATSVKESLINIENKSASAKRQTTSPDKQRLSLLEVTFQKNGTTVFYWKASEDSQKKKFGDYQDIRQTIEDSRPDGIRLRLDDRVSSGVFKKILADAASLDIAIYQSDQQE